MILHDHCMSPPTLTHSSGAAGWRHGLMSPGRLRHCRVKCSASPFRLSFHAHPPSLPLLTRLLIHNTKEIIRRYICACTRARLPTATAIPAKYIKRTHAHNVELCNAVAVLQWGGPDSCQAPPWALPRRLHLWPCLAKLRTRVTG